MFDSLKKYKGTLLTLVILVGGFWAFNQFGGTEAIPDSLLSTQAAQGNGSAAGQEIIRILDNVRTINLDTSIFDDETFNSLVDRTQEVTPEPQGRRNPFEPLGFGVNEPGATAEPSDVLNRIIGDDGGS